MKKSIWILLILMTFGYTRISYGQNGNFTFEAGMFLQNTTVNYYRNLPGAYVNILYKPKDHRMSFGLECSVMNGIKEIKHYDQLIAYSYGTVITQPDTFYNVKFTSAFAAISYVAKIRVRLTPLNKPEVFVGWQIGDMNLIYKEKYTNFNKKEETYSNHYVTIGMSLGLGMPIDMHQQVHLIGSIDIGKTFCEVRTDDGYSPPYNDSDMTYLQARIGLRIAL